MARLNYTQIENYGNNNKSSFFGLRDDGDVARVRFMYSGIEDVEGLAVHEVEVDGKRRYVNCLRDYNDPIDSCPFCKSNKFQLAKLYIPLYDVTTGEVKVWERGKKFFSQISKLCSRYPNLCSYVFEIERCGKKGDTSTTYMFHEIQHDNTTLNDLPSVPNVVGTYVLDKTVEEMQTYLTTGSFDGASRSSEMPIRRRTPATDRKEVF